MHHHQIPVNGHDMSVPCILLLTSNSAMGWLSTLSMMQWLQASGLVLGMVASLYVIYNQHLTARWKHRQNREHRDEHERPKNGRYNDQNNDDGGRY